MSIDVNQKRLKIHLDFLHAIKQAVLSMIQNNPYREPVKEAAYTIKRYWGGVLNWFKSGINTSILEGSNSLVQAAKARARGYRTTEYLITMIYLITGKLRFNLPS